MNPKIAKMPSADRCTLLSALRGPDSDPRKGRREHGIVKSATSVLVRIAVYGEEVTQRISTPSGPLVEEFLDLDTGMVANRFGHHFLRHAMDALFTALHSDLFPNSNYKREAQRVYAHLRDNIVPQAW